MLAALLQLLAQHLHPKLDRKIFPIWPAKLPSKLVAVALLKNTQVERHYRCEKANIVAVLLAISFQL